MINISRVRVCSLYQLTELLDNLARSIAIIFSGQDAHGYSLFCSSGIWRYVSLLIAHLIPEVISQKALQPGIVYGLNHCQVSCSVTILVISQDASSWYLLLPHGIKWGVLMLARLHSSIWGIRSSFFDRVYIIESATEYHYFFTKCRDILWRFPTESVYSLPLWPWKWYVDADW